MTRIQRIRQKIIDRAYYLSSQAEGEMLDDELERDDVEHVILKGRMQRKLSADRRGTRYRIEGPVKDGRLMHVICRFKADGDSLSLLSMPSLCALRDAGPSPYHRPLCA